jgi:preprotein translocase subunit SecF
MRLLKLIPDNTNVDFMRWRNIAALISIAAVVASLVVLSIRGLNLGIDFVGGQMVRTTFAQPVAIEQLRSRVGALGQGDATIQEIGDSRTYQIRLPKPEGPDAAAAAAVSALRAMIEREYPGAKVGAGESVSGKVSQELARDGALAIALAMLGVAIYIWFRFEWHFGVGALVTLFHDVSVMLGFFAATQLQVDLNIVAGFLAIVGYSLNETLSRTIVTATSILLALGMLLLLGPDTIFGLTLAIFIGTVIGTYSSIYVSAPMLVWLGLTPDSFVRGDPADPPAPQAA